MLDKNQSLFRRINVEDHFYLLWRKTLPWCTMTYHDMASFCSCFCILQQHEKTPHFQQVHTEGPVSEMIPNKVTSNEPTLVWKRGLFQSCCSLTRVHSLSLVDTWPLLPSNAGERGQSVWGRWALSLVFWLCKHQTFPLLLLKGHCKIRLSAFVSSLAAALPAVARCSSQPLHLLAGRDAGDVKAGKAGAAGSRGCSLPGEAVALWDFLRPQTAVFFVGPYPSPTYKVSFVASNDINKKHCAWLELSWAWRSREKWRTA